MPLKIRFLFLVWVIILTSSHLSGQVKMIEICNNGIDDDGDGLIDLNDPDCICLSDPVSHIPNPSFEKMTCCPSGHSQLGCAETWIQASDATTDYYNRCGYFERDQFPVPLPIPDGDAYVGFRNGHFSNRSPDNSSGNFPDNSPYDSPDKSNPNWKEYTGACLLAPLESGTEYAIQFSIGFVSNEISPPMNVVLYGTTDCKNLPFGVGDRQFGCPTNGPGWQVLGQVYVSGNHSWKQYKITTTPRQNITAIAIGPDCIELDLDINPYYFLDNLILADSDLFGPTIEEIGHPCQSDFSIVASERTNATYQWYRDGVALVGAVNRELKISGREGDYQVMMEIDSNCVLSKPYSYAIPTFDNRIRTVICPEAVYRFGDATLTRSGNYTQLFRNQDGCDSIVDLELIILEERIDSVKEYFFKGETLQIGRYKFDKPGNANLTLTSSLGCDSLVHLTLEEYALFIPNAFSPNGDGVNDYFTVYGSEDFIKIKSMRILDRWGNQVYEQVNNPPFRWDGSSKSELPDSGVYVYILDLILHDGRLKVVSGDVTLLR